MVNRNLASMGEGCGLFELGALHVCCVYLLALSCESAQVAFADFVVVDACISPPHALLPWQCPRCFLFIFLFSFRPLPSLLLLLCPLATIA